MPYKVFVADNYRSMDDSDDYEVGVFQTADEAIAAAQKVVDRDLEGRYQQGMKANELYKHYAMFGDDPYIVPVEPATESLGFSARQYARLRSQEICARK